jgi:hypothetical protein
MRQNNIFFSATSPHDGKKVLFTRKRRIWYNNILVGLIQVKGKGAMLTYFLMGIKA